MSMPKHWKPVRLSVVLLVFGFLVSTVWAAGTEVPAGKIETVKGQVTILRSDGRKASGAPGLALYAGDQVTTAKGSEVSFSLDPGGTFRLAEDGQFAIDELHAREVEDGYPLVRLALGFLRSKLGKTGSGTDTLQIHTPTAVVGVRGTEFDTVVSMDAASAIAVDEGQVEIDLDGEKSTLVQGKMLEVEMDGKARSQEEAVPRDRRDWDSWRKQRVQRLLKNLPTLAPRFASRFDLAVSRSERFTERLNRKAEEVQGGIREFREVRKKGDLRQTVRSRERLRRQVEEFNGMVKKFREASSRVRVMGRISHRVEGFATEKRARYTAEEWTRIDTSLRGISQKRDELRGIFTRTVANIRKTYGELREMKEEVSRERGGRRG